MTPHATKDELTAAWMDGYHERDALVRKMAARIEALSSALLDLYENAEYRTGSGYAASTRAFARAQEVLRG